MAEVAEALVVDASVAAKWHLQDEEGTTEALLLLQHFVQGRTELWAPDYIRYEVPAAITKATRNRRLRLSAAKGLEAIQAFLDLGIKTLDSSSLILNAYQLVHQYEIALYDALYLALAQHLGIPLLTADRRLYERVKHLPYTVWLGDYTPSAEP